VTKTPTFQTRIQRAVSGRELRLSDYPFPLWQFQLVWEALGDSLGRAGQGSIGSLLATDLRTLMGFYMACQGAFATFLYDDPTDDTVVGQFLPGAVSTLAHANFNAPGMGYAVNDVIAYAGGVLAPGGGATTYLVTGVDAAGGITGLTQLSAGAYAVVPGTINPFAAAAGGSGSGAELDGAAWTTTVQLSRTLGAPGGIGFVEPVTAPNVVSALYFNGITQAPASYSVDPATGIVTLAGPFTAAQPAITADFSYYFRCQFMSDAYSFENFMYRLWSLKKLDFISVRP
jgi:hypothetical protein